MNPLLDRLQPYPFERLRALFAPVSPPTGLRAISLGIGEPKHPTPAFIQEALVGALSGLASYPSTQGEPALRKACADWALRRHGVSLDVATQILPVNGSREGLFALAQAVINRNTESGLPPVVVSPNPFYQIYEGAGLLAGAELVYANACPQREFQIDWSSVSPAQWQRTQLVYVCSPGNPTGAVMPLEDWAMLFELSDRHGFVLASDECYSEIYFGADVQDAPLSSLQAAKALGRPDFKGLVMLTSLSKRSNVPGLRSGFVAGDAKVLAGFLRYRTYHGCAMSPAVQVASAAAWQDEAHVADNRAMYRQKFEAITPMLAQHLDVRVPQAGFYLWAGVPAQAHARAAHCGLSADEWFARELYAQYNVTVLPGSYLARNAAGINPGQSRVRMALVAEQQECLEAAQRICAFVESLSTGQ